MEPGTHDIREHTNLEEVMAKVSWYEDPDQMLVIQLTEEGEVMVAVYNNQEFCEPQPTLLEAIYAQFPECECRLREWEEEQYG